MYNPWGSVVKNGINANAKFSEKVSKLTHQMLEDAHANTWMATGLTGAGVGAGVGAVNGAVSYDGTFFGGAINGAMLGGAGGVGIKSFASVYSSGVKNTAGATKDFSWKTFNNGW